MPGLAGRNRPGSPEVTLGITELANSDDGFTLSVRTGARRLRLSSRRFRVCRAPFDMAAQGDRLFCRDRRGQQRVLQLANFRRALVANAGCFGFACVAQAISQFRFDFAKHRLQRVLHESIVGRGRHWMSSGALLSSDLAHNVQLAYPAKPMVHHVSGRRLRDRSWPMSSSAATRALPTERTRFVAEEKNSGVQIVGKVRRVLTP